MKKYLILLIPLLLCSCITLDYSRHADVSLTNKKIKTGKTFLVFPLINIHFNTAGSCFEPFNYKTYAVQQSSWNSQIKKYLLKKFPDQIFTFILEDEALLYQAESSYQAIRAEAELSSLAKIIKVINGQENPMQFFNSEKSVVMKEKIMPYLSKYPADYIILFINPDISSEIREKMVQKHDIRTGRMYREKESKEIMTTHVEVQVWDCRQGKLLFDSGAIDICKRGKCFKTIGEVALENNSRKLTDRLGDVVERTINKNTNE